MFKFFKPKQPGCFGNPCSLDYTCNECGVAGKCLEYIDRSFNDKGKFIIPTNKPLPKHSIKLSSKEPPKVKWTLETAREDYTKSIRECKKCLFSEKKEIDLLNNTRFKRTCLICSVKDKEIDDYEAEKCKYYTVEENKK